MATAFVPQSPEKIHDELESALNPDEQKSGKIFVFPQQPTEIFPQEPTPVDTGKVFNRPKTKLKTQVDVFKESPEGKELDRELRNILPTREESLAMQQRAQALGEGGQHRMTPEELRIYDREMGIDRKISRPKAPYNDITRPEWKKKLSSARDFLRKAASKDVAKKSLQFLSDISLGPLMDPNEVVQILTEAYNDGLLPIGELHKVEEIMGVNVKIEQEKPADSSPVATENETHDESTSVSEEVVEEPVVRKTAPPKKVRIPTPREPVHIPGPEPMSATIDTKQIKDTLQKKYEPKKTPVAEEIVSGIPHGSDERFSAQAKKSYEAGDIGDALVFVTKIQEEYDRDVVIREIVVDAVGKKDFAAARKFVDKIKDENYKVDLAKWVNSHVKLEMPEIDTIKGDIKLTKPTVDAVHDASIIDDTKHNVSEKMEDSLDLPLHSTIAKKEMDLDIVNKVETEEPVVVPESVKVADTDGRIAGIRVKRESSVEPIPIINSKKTGESTESKIIVPKGFDSPRNVKNVGTPQTEKNEKISSDGGSSLEDKVDFDKKILFLRNQIREAEKTRNEPKVISLENELRIVERQKILVNKMRESVPSKLETRIKEQIAKVKAVEDTDEKAYAEELSKLRVLERERDSLRAPKSEVVSQKKSENIEKVLEGVVEKSVNNEELLDKAREDYAQAYVDWELKTRKAKRLFLKTIKDLGGSRPVPARLSSETPAMQEAKVEYMKAMKNSNVDIEKDSKKLLLSEKLLLQNRIQELRALKSKKDGDTEAVKEVNLLDKALSSWKKSSTKQKVIASALLVGGGVMLGAIEEGKDFYEGLRVGRTEAAEKIKLPDLPKPPVLAQIESIPKIKVPENIPPVPVVEFKKENKINITKKREPINISIPKPSVPTNSVETTPMVETVQIVDEPVIPVGDVEPDAVEKAVQPEVLQGIKDHIPYNNTFVDVKVLDNGIGKAVMYNGIEIGHERDLGGQKIFSLDDQFQEDGKFRDIRGAFSTFLKENMPKIGLGIEPISFDSGVINIVSDPSSENRILALLNGKVIGVGDSTEQKVKIKTLKELKKAWFLESEYERAVKEANNALKATYNRIPILK